MPIKYLKKRAAKRVASRYGKSKGVARVQQGIGRAVGRVRSMKRPSLSAYRAKRANRKAAAAGQYFRKKAGATAKRARSGYTPRSGALVVAKTPLRTRARSAYRTAKARVASAGYRRTAKSYAGRATKAAKRSAYKAKAYGRKYASAAWSTAGQGVQSARARWSKVSKKTKRRLAYGGGAAALAGGGYAYGRRRKRKRRTRRY